MRVVLLLLGHTICALFSMVLVVNPALAKAPENPPQNPAAPWQLASIAAPNGLFAFCRAELPDAASGLTLAVALSPAHEVNLGIKVPDGGFKTGEQFPLTIKIDDLFTRASTAEAGMAELLLLRLGADAKFLPALAKGKTITLQGAADSTVFQLTNSGKMVQLLQQCVAAGGAASKAVAGQLPPGLAMLLQESGLQYKVTQEGGAGAAVDHSWQVAIDGQQIDGGFKEVRVKPDESLASLRAAMVEKLKQQCAADGKSKLDVKSDAAQKLAGLEMQTLLVTCAEEQVGVILYKTITNIFGTLMHRGTPAQSKEILAARDAVAKVVQRVGNEKE